MKKNFSGKNLLAVFYVSFLVINCYTYINVQTIYLLRNPDLFDVNDEIMGRVTSKLMFYATLTSLFSVLIAGYLYDLFGRKTLIMINFICVSGGTFLYPRTAPNIPLLMIIRACIQLFGAANLSHPLIVDYIKKESRGKAIAI